MEIKSKRKNLLRKASASSLLRKASASRFERLKKKKPKFCKLCDGTKFKGHHEDCPEGKRIFDCINNYKSDCIKTFNKFDACELCLALKVQEIIIEESGDNPHLPDMFKRAIGEFRDTFWKRWHEEPYRVCAIIINQEVNQELVEDNYDYADYNWLFTFKVVKK